MMNYVGTTQQNKAANAAINKQAAKDAKYADSSKLQRDLAKTLKGIGYTPPPGVSPPSAASPHPPSQTRPSPVPYQQSFANEPRGMEGASVMPNSTTYYGGAPGGVGVPGSAQNANQNFFNSLIGTLGGGQQGQSLTPKPAAAAAPKKVGWIGGAPVSYSGIGAGALMGAQMPNNKTPSYVQQAIADGRAKPTVYPSNGGGTGGGTQYGIEPWIANPGGNSGGNTGGGGNNGGSGGGWTWNPNTGQYEQGGGGTGGGTGNGAGTGAPGSGGNYTTSINPTPIWSQQAINNQVNSMRALNDQQAATQSAQNNSQFAARGFGANSPLAAALNNQTMSANRANNAQNENLMRWTAAEGNARNILQGETARAGEGTALANILAGLQQAQMGYDASRENTLLNQLLNMLNSQMV